MRILAVSGGGAQGMFAASVLARAEARLDGPLVGHFGLVGGTSIGAALAAGVAFGVPAERMRAAIREAAPRIFPPLGVSDPMWEKAASMAKGIHRARHRTGPWREVLEGLLGKVCMGDAPVDLAIPALDLTAGGALVVFRRRPLGAGDPPASTPVVEAVLASSAAPTLFRPHRWNGRVYGDGGMAANAPDALLLAEGWHRHGGCAAMLSVGTGLARMAGRFEGDLDWGLAQWARGGKLPALSVAATQNGPVETARLALGAAHCRMDVDPTDEERRHIGLDCATVGALVRLDKMAERADWGAFGMWCAASDLKVRECSL